MNLQDHLALSYYNEIGQINAEHNISIVQHIDSKNIYVKKILDVYNLSVYEYLKSCSFHGLPKLYEVIESDNKLILIEEYISGDTLEAILNTNGPLPEQTVIKYTLQLCDILTNLHQSNPSIIHRDIKPSNIIITPSDNVVLLDLNAAKYINPYTDSDTKLIGTKGYAAPEQYGFGSSNTKTDIYAIGMVMNTMLAGLFSSSVVPSQLSPIIQKCTELSPDSRFESIDQLKQAIYSFNNKYNAQIQDSTDTTTQENKPTQSWLRFLPPGYRSKNWSHIILATPSYTLLIYLCLGLEVKDVSPAQLYIERFFCFIVFLSIIACLTNYLDIHKIIPLGNNKNPIVKYIGLVIFTFVLIFVEFTIMAILLSIVH